MQKRYCMIWLSLLIAVACSPQATLTPQTEMVSTPTSVSLADTDSNIVLFRGNPQRTGVYDMPAIRSQAEVKWQVKVGSTWLMPPIVADGFLYTGSGDGVLYALDADTGEQVWSADGFGQLESTGAIAGDAIVSGGYSKLVKTLDRKTGEELWSYTTDYVIQGSPLIIDDRVYIATDHAVYALDVASGRLIWETAPGSEDAYMGAPAYDEGVIYTTGGKLLIALDSETGEELWRVEREQDFLGLAVANQLVHVGNWDGHLYAFDQSTGEERWKFEANNEFWSAPAVTEKMVYAGIGDQLVALSTQTGESQWSFETDGEAVSEPLVSDGVVYVSDSSHTFPRGARHLYALDAATGELLWTFETISTFLPAPALGNGVLFVTSTGEVVALE